MFYTDYEAEIPYSAEKMAAMVNSALNFADKYHHEHSVTRVKYLGQFCILTYRNVFEGSSLKLINSKNYDVLVMSTNTS